MSYSYFEPGQVEAAMREMRETALQRVLAGATTATEKIGYLQQDRFFEPMLAAQLQMVGLLNENVCADRIGKVVGSFLGSIIVNTISASAEPEVCWVALNQSMMRMVNILGEDDLPDISASTIEIVGTPGGRA